MNADEWQYLLSGEIRATLFGSRGRYREALPYYREAIDTLDQLYSRTRGLSEETRQAFLGQYSNIYLETIKLLLQIHRANPTEGFDRQILEVASRNQSRIFTEMMRQRSLARLNGLRVLDGLREPALVVGTPILVEVKRADEQRAVAFDHPAQVAWLGRAGPWPWWPP